MPVNLRWIFPIFGQSPAAVEPCEGALDDPSSGNDFEAFRSVEALDDLDCPVTDAFKSVAQLWSGITAIRKDMAQVWMGIPDGFQHFRCAITVLNTGAMHDQPNHKPERVGDNVALAALGFLARRHSPKCHRFPLFLWSGYQ